MNRRFLLLGSWVLLGLAGCGSPAPKQTADTGFGTQMRSMSPEERKQFLSQHSKEAGMAAFGGSAIGKPNH